jgi:DNA-binding NtrC family response regulator
MFVVPRCHTEEQMRQAKHIVLVQNDQYLIDTRKTLLEKQGYFVQAVHTVDSARAICRNLDCDLVIVDSEEDYNSALELCEEVKAENPGISVAVITWDASALESECPDEVIRRERGPQEFLKKVRLALA